MSKRIAKNAEKQKGQIQFDRTTKKTGKWRGKIASAYKKYTKSKKKI